ncbi:MAG: oligoendopeptidase F [Clostridiales bacterium]|nr:oligoendopeptidase F [Clostridiales bacterium]
MDEEKQSGKQIPCREQVDQAYKWRVGDIYAHEADWRADVERVKTLIDQAAGFSGQLGLGPLTLLDFLRRQDELGQLLNRVYLFAAMKRDEDNRVDRYQAMRDTAEGLAISAAAHLAFFEPELLALPTEVLGDYLQNPDIAVYQKYIDDILRHKPHILDAEQERLLAEAAEMAAAFDNIYSMLADADIIFPFITNEQEEAERLSHGNYIRFLQSGVRRLRKDAFFAMYNTYGQFANTIAATFSASVKKDAFYAKARLYNSALEASLFDDNVPVQVYHQLIKTVRHHLPLYHRYLQLRRRMLELDELRMYDIYVPLLAEPQAQYSYEQATDTVLAALKPLGEEYTEVLAHGLRGGWVDVYENQGKTSGAYSSGVYGTAPYILMNYQHNLNGLFTLAHEAGHSMHSYFTWQKQPFVYGNYCIFVAEVASTVNENLLVNHLLDHAPNKREIFSLLNHFMDEFRGNVFRQTMFAEFELEAHKQADAGQPLTAEGLNALYLRLNRDYFGPDTVMDEEIAREWMRIPHFYRAFYVYKYATGFCAAMSLCADLLDASPAKAAAAKSRYLRFLSAGSSAHPLDLLKEAGVDMMSPEPVERAMGAYEKMLNRMVLIL